MCLNSLCVYLKIELSVIRLDKLFFLVQDYMLECFAEFNVLICSSDNP